MDLRYLQIQVYMFHSMCMYGGVRERERESVCENDLGVKQKGKYPIYGLILS